MLRDEHDVRKGWIEDQMVQAATDKAHQEEAVWLLLHVKDHIYPRFEENREWYERWQAWIHNEQAAHPEGQAATL